METFTRAQIIDQLNKILSSPQVCHSAVLTDFLKHVVSETIEGRSGELKEYTIGVAALRKETDFNPQLDSIVRIHAGRLRRALKDYYREEGVNDLILITIPKGSYVPVFESRAQDDIEKNNVHSNSDETTRRSVRSDSSVNGHSMKPALKIRRPTLAVLPFRYFGADPQGEHFAAGLSQQLSTELSHFSEFQTTSYFTGITNDERQNDFREQMKAIGVEYIISGSIQSIDKHLRVYVQVSSFSTGIQLWGKTIDKADKMNAMTFQDEVVDRVLSFISGADGIIWRKEYEKIAVDQLSDQVQSYWYYQFKQNFDAQTTLTAKKYYEEIVAKDSRNAVAIAYLSEIYSVEGLFPETKTDKVNRGLAFAHLALKIDPRCQQAYLALGMNLLLFRNNEECLKVLREGLKVNPKSIDYRSSMGAIMIFAGAYEEGIQLLDEVAKLNPGLYLWQTISYSLYAFYRKSYSDALYWIDRVEQNVIWKPIIKAAAYAQLDQLKEAKNILKQMKKDYPSVDLLKQETLGRFFHSNILVEELKSGIMKVHMN